MEKNKSTTQGYIFEQIKSVVAGNYDLRAKEILAIKDKNGGSPIDCICDAFRLGFLRGQRSEKSREKKAQKI